MDWMSLLPNAVTLLTGLGVVSAILVKMRKVLKEVAELMAAIVGALSEEGEGGAKITTAELQMIIKEAKDIGQAIKDLRKKK